jgi:hypothetical protein
MSFQPISDSLHCSAPLPGPTDRRTFLRVLVGLKHAVLVGSHIFILLSAREAVLLALSIGAAFALALAWRSEKLGGLTARPLGAGFFLYCLLAPGMPRVWSLGVALALPGLLFARATALNQEHPQSR